MRKVIIIVLILILIVAVAVAGFIYFKKMLGRVSDDSEDISKIVSAVNYFGDALKNVSLLSETAATDIEANYKDFLSPDLLNQWKENPSSALGRVTLSPLPDRIEINGIEKVSDAEYLIKGNIIEMINAEETQEGVAGKREVTINVQKINGKWLIAAVSL